MAPPPPVPPGSPPKPPPRRAPERADEAAPALNPFIAADPLLGNVEVPLTEGANPFLAPSPQVAPSPQEQQPARAPGGPQRGAQRGAAGPEVRDPHAEFRKGSWKKPAIFLAVAALMAGGLFFGLPSGTEEKKDALVASPEAVTVIGRSVSPEIIQDPDQPNLSQPNPPAARSKVPEEPGESPDRPDQSGSFASMFKSAGK